MIRFGTDGWRARIAEEFTVANVSLVAQAVVNYLKKSGPASYEPARPGPYGRPGPAEQSIVVGYDNRFFSERYAEQVAQVAAFNGIRTYLTQESVPSPVLSFSVKTLKAAGGIMITASHNPPEWNGFKFKTPQGGSAPLGITQAIEQEIRLLEEKGPPASLREALRVGEKPFLIETFDPKPDYFKHLKTLVNLDLIASSNIKVVVDPMHGSGGGYFSDLLGKKMEVIEINHQRDPLFGGINPEPLPLNLEELISTVKEYNLKTESYPTPPLWVGLALDGDADRIGAVDAKGHFINSHQIFALLLKHLVEHRGLTGRVVKTFNITQLIDRLGQKYNLKIFETPIGFKYICDLMLKEDILIGGEESGGIGIKGHIPERDGTLAGLLLLELMAVEKKTLGEILAELSKELGVFYYDRIDLHIDDKKKNEALKRLKENPPDKLAGLRVARREDLDGYKFFLEDSSWILFRASGTEPLLRIYCEATSEEKVKQLLDEGYRFIS